MSGKEINARQENQAKVFETAKRIREILDQARREISLPDDREVEEEILALVTEE
jgi:hypothetical protein